MEAAIVFRDIYIYEPATFWVHAPLDFIYSCKSKGE